MYSIFVPIKVKPEHIAEFGQASVIEGQSAVRDEPGCYRFEVHTDRGDPAQFYFYEVFEDERAAQAHWQTENFKVWRETIDHMVDGAFGESVEMQTVFPSDTGYLSQKPSLVNV